MIENFQEVMIIFNGLNTALIFFILFQLKPKKLGSGKATDIPLQDPFVGNPADLVVAPEKKKDLKALIKAKSQEALLKDLEKKVTDLEKLVNDIKVMEAVEFGRRNNTK